MQLGLHVSGTSCSYKPPVLMFPSGRSQGNSTVVEIGKIYCNDHSSLSTTTAVQYEFHICFLWNHVENLKHVRPQT